MRFLTGRPPAPLLRQLQYTRSCGLGLEEAHCKYFQTEIDLDPWEILGNGNPDSTHPHGIWQSKNQTPSQGLDKSRTQQGPVEIITIDAYSRPRMTQPKRTYSTLTMGTSKTSKTHRAFSNTSQQLQHCLPPPGYGIAATHLVNPKELNSTNTDNKKPAHTNLKIWKQILQTVQAPYTLWPI